MNLEELDFKQEKPIAFVIPRCSEEIAGGAEALCLNLASKIQKFGIKTEILTTCAKDNRSWNNYYPKGEGVEKGVKVLRFPVNERNLDLWIPLQLKLQDGFKLTIEEELLWMEENVHSFELYDYISKNGDKYNSFIFAPYLFGTSFFGSQIYPEKSFLLPCLHREMYAELTSLKAVFKNVKGCIFNANAEKELAKSYYGELKGGEVGLGFNSKDYPEVESYSFDFEYILYVGRKETGKNVQTLIDYFIYAKDNKIINKDLKLVIVGPGDYSDILRPGTEHREDIVDLPLVTEAEKAKLIKNAITLCQPSKNESFSIVLMEAWLQNTSVLVHGDCAVTKEHVVDSNGGLYFEDELEFAFAINELVENKNVNLKLAENGLNYVKAKYSWEAVIKRFLEVSSNLGIISIH